MATLFAFAVAGIAGVASSQVCARAMTMQMPGGASAPGGVVAMCPVVLCLIVASTLLATWTLDVLRRDPHAGFELKCLARALARLPVLRAFSLLCAGGAGAVGTIVAVDGGITFSLGFIALLAAIVAGGALAALTLSLAFARAAVALWTRLAFALAEVLSGARPRPSVAFPRRRPRVAFIDAVVAGYGLRAPPIRAH
jgi:hypothetical protein